MEGYNFESAPKEEKPQAENFENQNELPFDWESLDLEMKKHIEEAQRQAQESIPGREYALTQEELKELEYQTAIEESKMTSVMGSIDTLMQNIAAEGTEELRATWEETKEELRLLLDFIKRYPVTLTLLAGTTAAFSFASHCPPSVYMGGLGYLSYLGSSFAAIMGAMGTLYGGLQEAEKSFATKESRDESRKVAEATEPIREAIDNESDPQKKAELEDMLRARNDYFEAWKKHDHALRGRAALKTIKKLGYNPDEKDYVESPMPSMWRLAAYPEPTHVRVSVGLGMLGVINNGVSDLIDWRADRLMFQGNLSKEKEIPPLLRELSLRQEKKQTKKNK